MRHGPLLPVGPIRRTVLEWMDKRGETIESVSHLTGITERALYRILRESEKVSFPLADQLITLTVGPLYWQIDEELSDIYYGCSLKRLDKSVPVTA